MKNVIIGTAGHVDHGKTLLIKALTGTDTDRLEEEKRRGITIDLGFAVLNNDKGIDIGIIDVPGHEKFIKNMLAGALGIDIVLLVVAADEGIMPQTREHFEIVKNLGIKNGIPVITKCDTVDDKTIELVKKQLKEYLSDGFLSDEKIFTVSAKNKQGIEDLKAAIIEKALLINDKNKETPFRMPVDRVFTITGFGTIVTGTTIEGRINKGDEITVYPSMIKTRVRNIQVHDTDADFAEAGQRTALNLSGISKEEILRGDVISTESNMKNSMILDVKISLFKDTKRKLANNDRVHLYLGSKEILAKVVLIGTDILSKGQTAYAQLRLEENIAAKRNDPFIIRFYSPLESFGGGIVLNPEADKQRRNRQQVLSSMKKLESSSLNDAVEALADLKDGFTDVTYVQRVLSVDKDEVLNCQNIFSLKDSYIMSKSNLDKLFKGVEKIFNDLYKSDKLALGIRPNELKTKVKYAGDYNVTESLINLLTAQNRLVLKDGYLNLKSHEPDFTNREKKIIEDILREYEEMGLVLRSLDNQGNRKMYIEYLVRTGDLIVLDKNIYITESNFKKAEDKFRELSENGGVSLASFRDYAGTSRKSALLILDAFDKREITVKIEDLRYLV